MLCQFTVKNYRSLKEEATLSMLAIDGLSEHRDSLIIDSDQNSFLPITAIYGPNGGGKSTVLDALYSLCFKVMNPVVAASQGEGGRPSDSFSHKIVPYLLDEDSVNRPTEFSLVFRTAEYEYEYTLSVLNGAVVSESLYHKKILNGRYTKVFERDGNKFSLVQSLSRLLNKEEQKSIPPQLPLLSYLGIVNGRHVVIHDVITWFVEKIHFLDYKDSFAEHFMNLPEEGSMKESMLELLSVMGTDIRDYRLEKLPGKSSDTIQVNILTKHVVHEKEYWLELHQESSGTIKIFNSLPHIISILKTGGTLIVDELDAKLHPALLQYVMHLFSDKSINIHGAQLIFTSQDVMTMTSENFRRDEIWFVAKNIDEESQLYALSDFRGENGEKARKDASFSKQYMEGRYGADPFFKKLIDWRD